MDLPLTSQNGDAPAVVSEQRLSAETLRRRGAVLTGEAVGDWPWLRSAGRGLIVSGLPGTLVTLDGLRLAPATRRARPLSRRGGRQRRVGMWRLRPVPFVNGQPGRSPEHHSWQDRDGAGIASGIGD